MKPLIPMHKIYLIVGITIAVVAGSFTLYIEPERAELATQAEEASLAAVELELARQTVGNTSDLQTQYQSVLEIDNDLGLNFFAIGQELEFFQALEQLASETGVILTTQFTPKTSDEVLRTIPATLSVSGSTPAILTFIDGLERLPQLITVNSLTMAAGETTAASLQISTLWTTANE